MAFVSLCLTRFTRRNALQDPRAAANGESHSFVRLSNVPSALSAASSLASRPGPALRLRPCLGWRDHTAVNTLSVSGFSGAVSRSRVTGVFFASLYGLRLKSLFRPM